MVFGWISSNILKPIGDGVIHGAKEVFKVGGQIIGAGVRGIVDMPEKDQSKALAELLKHNDRTEKE